MNRTRCRRTSAAIRIGAAALLALAAGVGFAATNPPPPLGHYGIDAKRVTVSGLSSGGYMAVQLHVAYSSVFSGVGVIAAGPYGCAETGAGVHANASRAVGPCMAGRYSALQRVQCWALLATCLGTDAPDVAASIALARANAKQQLIDPLSNLSGRPVFLLSGAKDTRVIPEVVDALHAFYQAFGADIHYEDRRKGIAHTFPTQSFASGNACGTSSSPYVSDCNYDAAKHLLDHLYGTYGLGTKPGVAGRLIGFDQTRFFGNGDPGMADVGYVYLPAACEGGSTNACPLHVALHGCKQTAADVGKDFVEGTGFNRWADAHGVVVLYPQVAKSFGNPDRCWDWWGYTGGGWSGKQGAQLRAIKAMVDHLKSAFP